MIADHYALDMSDIKFIKPYGIIALVSLARRLAQRSGQPVLLSNIPGIIYSYLDRMNLFQIGVDWLKCAAPLEDVWLRKKFSHRLLELTTIGGPQDVESIVAHARAVFYEILKTPDLGALCVVLSELCANVYQHSADPHGCALIQKYGPYNGIITVDFSVGDLGRGIKTSLKTRHGSLGLDTVDYLKAAMHGQTSRLNGRGGFGLRRVKQIVESYRGYLWMRSDDAAILINSVTPQGETFTSLPFVPGAQLAVELKAPV
jgi:hypothetical protein